MRKIIRLTENDLHNIVNKSVNRILQEMDLKPKMSTHDVYGRGLSRKSDGTNWSRQRRRPMTQQQDLGGANVDAINKVLFPSHTPQMAKDQMKRKSQYGLMNPPSVKESDLHNIVKEAVNRILQEDGLGGTSSFSLNSPAGGASDPTGQVKNTPDAPALGGKNKKKVGGNAFSEPIMRQAHNLGDVTQAKTNQVDMGETEKRSKDFKNGSMAMQRVGGKK